MRLAALLTVLLAAAGAFGWLHRRRAASEPVEESARVATAHRPTTASREAVSDAPRTPRRTLRIPDRTEGSKIDPDAPPHPLASFIGAREAEIRRWDGTKIELERGERSLRDILAEIGRRYDLTARVDASVPSDLQCRIAFGGARGAVFLHFLISEHDLAWVVNEAGESWIVPRGREHVYEPAAWVELDRARDIRELVASDEDPVPRHPDAVRIDESIDRIKISMNFTETSLEDMLEFLREVTRLEFEVDAPAASDVASRLVTFKAEEAPLREALRDLLEGAGLAFLVGPKGIVVTTPAGAARPVAEEPWLHERRARIEAERAFFEKRVTLPAEDLAIRDVAELLSKATATGYVIDQATWSRAAIYGFDGEERTIGEIAKILFQGAPVRVVYRDGKMWFLESKSATKTD